MNYMQLPSTMHPAKLDMNGSYTPLWLTSSSYEFPNYTLLNPSLSDGIALLLYSANIMDQKKMLCDFYNICKNNFENKCETSVLESAIKTWIRHSIVKLHRRREQIISEAVSTWQTQMICTLSQILLNVFHDLLGESSKKGSSFDVCARSKGNISSVGAYIMGWRTLFIENEAFLPNCSNCHADISWNEFFCPLSFKENKNQVSLSKTHPMQWLKRFWLEFCYQPHPTNYVRHISREVDEIADLNFVSPKNRISNTYDTNFLLHSNDELSSISSNENSDSSDSWSCADFADESPSEDDTPRTNISRGIIFEKCNATLAWVQSDSCQFTEWGSDSDDESVIFSDFITEENCLDRGGTKGSLCFVDVDCSDEEDDCEVLFVSGSSAGSFPTNAFEEASLGYENPCFEDTFSSFSVPSFIKSVNECWSEEMLDIKDKPRQPSKVSFAPDSSLVTVHCFEKTENAFDSSAILDRLRFQYRVRELSRMLTPFLAYEHRAEIQRQNGFYQD